MSSTSIDGLISGLDTTSLIDALVASRSGPIQLLEQRRTDKTAQLTAWKSFEAILVGLKVEADRLSDSKLWDAPLVSSSDEEILTATGDKTAVLDRYELFVSQLALSHQLGSASYGSADELVGTGTLSISVGGETTDLTVESGTAVEDLVEQINAADAGATASLVRSVEGGAESFTIVLTADETGEENTLSVSSGLTGGTDPAFTTEVRPPQDAIIHFGGEGGLAIHSATNTFTDLVAGVDVTVHRRQETGDPGVTLEINRDLDRIADSVKEFVDRYNSVMSFVNDQFRYDPEVGNRPPLMGSSTLTTVAGSIRSGLFAPTENLPDSAAFRSLLDIGFSTSATGAISFDATEFRAALEEDFDSAADLFRLNGTFDAEGLELLAAPTGVDLTGRNLEIQVTQAASRALVLGDQFDLGAGGITVSDTNDSFRIEIDGVRSEEISIAHGTYTDGEDLARAIEDAIDADEELGALGVRVGFEPGAGTSGRLTFTSNRFGSDGSILLSNTGGTFFSDLGLDGIRNVEHEGLDVLATIDGVAVEGKGRILRLTDDDSEGLAGLEIRVTLDEAGVPGTFTASFTEGMSRGMARTLENLTDSSDGVLKRTSDSVQDLIDRYDRDLESKLDQLERYRESLRRRYAAMEATLGQLQTQSQYLGAQVSALSASGLS